MPETEKKIFHFWMSPTGRAWLERLASEHNVPLAAVMRAALQVASRHQDQLDKELETLRKRF